MIRMQNGKMFPPYPQATIREVLAFIADHPEMTLIAIGKHWNIKAGSIKNWMRKYGVKRPRGGYRLPQPLKST